MNMADFDYFVVFAEMRTGSNYLEANINLFHGLHCYGEAFNPSFIGYPQYNDVLGISLEARETDPGRLIDAFKADADLAGFRFFNDHDPRVLELCLPDPRCAKIILTRNPVDSFISWKIARSTGQWKLTNATHAKTQQVDFEHDEFTAYLDRLQQFQLRLQKALQHSGQTAFYLTYDDLSDVDTVNGLARFLGCKDQLTALDRKLKKQNPAPATSKVKNPEEMAKTLADLDRFDLGRTPHFEPRRGPMIPAYLAAPETPLLYLPLRGGLDGAMGDWLAALDGRANRKALRRDFTQKSLRQWKQNNPGHRSFAVLRHPVVRAHNAFCSRILFDGPLLLPKIRQTLRKVHRLPIPADPLLPRNLKGYGIDDHRKAFKVFLDFLRSNLTAQTAVRTDPSWASQLSVLQGMAQFGLPDMILREAHLDRDITQLCAQVGISAPPAPSVSNEMVIGLLREIYDDEIERSAREAYQRDFASFGFDRWQR